MSRLGRATDTLHATALIGHIVCCGAPMALNVIALAFGAGLLGAASPWLDVTHGVIHGRETLLLGVSAALVATGGVVQFLSWREDCGRTACGHGSCAPKKPRRLWLFSLVCVLFAVNLGLFVWHREVGGEFAVAAASGAL